MQAINTLLSHGHSTLLIAPTGWGKTTLLLDLMKNSNKTWVYLAPLRALANEFYTRAQKKIKSTILISHAYEVQNILIRGLDFKLIVITPELLSSELMMRMKKETNFVFDEIHLFYYWGDAFRPKLIEVYIDIIAGGYTSLFLSATMTESLLDRWSEDLRRNSHRSYIINIKNHTFKKEPLKTSYIPVAFQKTAVEEFLNKPCKHTKLLFCAYRNQVQFYEQKILELGYTVVSCIGGETQFLGAKLNKNPYPDFIISTIAISHGVNLPKISMVYISYAVKNYDFWVQMVGRGGRQGEEFEVYSMDNYRITKLNKVLSILNLLRIKLWAKIFPYELRRYFNSQNSR